MEKTGSLISTVLGVVIIALLAVLIVQNQRSSADPAFATPYQGVLLTNGQAFFGKLENAGGAFPILRDVYYIRSQVNQETKQVLNQLVKRGSELHGPDHMVLNKAHILVIEPVRVDSQVAKLIDQASKGGGGAPAAGAPGAVPPQSQQPPVPQVK
jgi:hypothetical protein